MRKFSLLICLLISISLLFSLPIELTKKGNPTLYKKLNKLAKTNIKTMPIAPRYAYAALLKAHPDALMAYLVAYENNASLSATDPATVESNYLEIVKLLDKDGLRYSPEFFLSYVAKQSVSDEPITPYRKAFLKDDMQRILDGNQSDIDKYRASTLWCVSRLQFQQTSGRDQSPLDITERSLIGRCEEMQILYVAAARTVGLPARPASAPWWAHMDNNHAWAEVFLDGAWHYTGDMDSAYFPDQTWFSGMIDKTVLILADGSLASEKDEILASGRYDTVINSTRNYAKERTRLIKVSVTDTEGKPIGKANIIPMVFNWGSLRALSIMNADDKGYLEFSAGRGAFYLSIAAGKGKALVFVPSSTEVEHSISVTLLDKPFDAAWATMEYPANDMHWDNQPEEYRAAVQAEKKLWQQKVDAFKSEIDKHSCLADSLVYEVAMACRGNNLAFRRFVESNAGNVAPEFLDYLLINDPKFLWQASSEQFSALYHNWQWLAKGGLSEEEQLSLFSPTVFYEDIPKPFYDSNREAQLYPAALRYQEPHSREGIINILSYIKKGWKISAKKALSGLPPFDIAYKQKYLSPAQYRIFACNVLRANGYPAGFSRIPDLISVFIDEDWQYVNVNKLSWEDMSGTAKPQTFTLNVYICDENELPLKAADEQLSLCRYMDGMFYPLNSRFEYLGDGLHRGVFPIADTYLQFGYRVSDSKTRFYNSHIEASAGDSLYVKLLATDYPRTWEQPTDEIISLFDETTLSRESIILLGSYDQENCMRLADKLKAAGKSFLWVGFYNAPGVANYVVNPAWQQMVRENNRNSLRSITLYKKDGVWQMYEGLWDKLP